MKLTKAEALDLLKVSESTWKRNTNKEELFERYGYQLVKTEKVGRSVFFYLEQPENEEDNLKRKVREIFKFNADFDLAMFLRATKIWLESDTPVSHAVIAKRCGVSTRTVANWKNILIEANVFAVDSEDATYVRHYPDEGMATKANLADWKAYCAYCASYEQFWIGAAQHKRENGFFIYKTSKLNPNVFMTEFYELLSNTNTF